MGDILRYADFQEQLSRSAAAGPTVPMQFSDTGTLQPVPPGGLTGAPARDVKQGDVGRSLAGAAVDAVCLFRSKYPQTLLGRITGLADNAVPPGVRNARERAFNNLCGETPEAQPELGPPFSGGQCDGVAYFVSVDGAIQENFPDCTFTVQRQSQTVEHWGPIGGARANSPAPGLIQIYTRGSVSDGPPKAPAWRGLTSFGNFNDCGGGAIVTNVNVSRSDSLPDSCGEPPLVPIQNPQDSPPVNIDIDFPISPTVNLNFPVDVSIGNNNRINIDVGDISIGFDGVDIDIDFNPEFGGDTNLPPDGAGGGDCAPDSPDDAEGRPVTPPPEPPADNPPAPEEPPAATDVIRGAFVTMTGGLGGSTRVLTNSGGVPAFFPDLGLVSFQVTLDGGLVGWTSPQRIQRNQGYYECEAFFGASDVKVTARPGLTARIDRVYYKSDEI